MESSEGGNAPPKETITKINHRTSIKPYGIDVILAFNANDPSSSNDEEINIRKQKILEGIDLLVTHDLDMFSKGWLHAARDTPSILQPDATDPSQVVIHNNVFTSFMFLVGHAAFVMEPSLLQTTTGLRGYYNPTAEPYEPRVPVQHYHIGTDLEIPSKRKLSGLDYDHQFMDAAPSRRTSLSNSYPKEGDPSSERRLSQTYPEAKRSRSNSFTGTSDDESDDDSDTPRSPNAKFTFKVPKNKPKNGAFAKQWLDHYDQLKEFKRAHGHVNVTRTTKGYQHLGSWIATQRRKLRRGKLTEDQFKILSDLGLEWDRSHYFKAAVYRDPAELQAEGQL